MKKIIIGARGSKLSLIYANKVKNLILEKETNLSEENIVIKKIKTSGDIFKDKKLSEIGGKKLFCKEIEESLLKKEIDIAVHALKDMETEDEKNLIIVYYPNQEVMQVYFHQKQIHVKIKLKELYFLSKILILDRIRNL